MPVTTLGYEKKSSVPIIAYVIGVVSIGLFVFFGGEIIRNFDKLKGKAVLTTNSLYTEADVYVDGKLVGKTPLDNIEITPGEKRISIVAPDMQYETTLNVIPNSKENSHNVGIFRDLGVSNTFSSGQEFWFEKDQSGNVLRIVSDPAGASVFIDGSEIGKTPFSSTALSEGGYALEVSYPGYEKQTARINVQKNYTVNISIKLFPIPVPTTVTLLAGSTDIYSIISDNSHTISDLASWVKACVYWNKTRGVKLIEQETTTDLVFDYFIDYKGNLYNKEGNRVENIEELVDVKIGAYLNRISDGGKFTDEAKEAFRNLSDQVPIGGEVATIKETGFGWLRVRNAPSGTEVAKVDVGGTYEVVEKTGTWVKIKVSDSLEGWVSITYVDIS